MLDWKAVLELTVVFLSKKKKKKWWFGLKWNDDCCSWLMMFAQILFNNKATHTDSLRYSVDYIWFKPSFVARLLRSGWNGEKKKEVAKDSQRCVSVAQGGFVKAKSNLSMSMM